MSQHDFNIANQTFPSFRSDLNDALQAAATISAGATAPTTPYAYQLWYDTANEKYMIRNAANSAWLNFVGIDTNGNVNVTGTLTADGLTVDGDLEISSASPEIYLMESDTTDVNTRIRTSVGDFRIESINDAKSSIVLRQLIDHATGDISFYEDTGTTAKFFWDASAEMLGIGTVTPNRKLTVQDSVGTVAHFDSTGTSGGGISLADANTTSNYVRIRAVGNDMQFTSGNSEAMRIDSSGNVLVGKTASNVTVEGCEIRPSGFAGLTVDGGAGLTIRRLTSDGELQSFFKDTTKVGSIGASSSLYLHIGSDSGTNPAFLRFVSQSSPSVRPSSATGSNYDNALDLGVVTARFDDVYATNGTIQTSDANEKQQIAALTDAEITAAKAISQLFKTFKWNDKVAEKGDAARTHTGVIAQDVQAAMTAAGLDAGDYAFFISGTWWETQTEVPAVEAVEAVDAVYEDVVIPAVEEELDEEGNVIVEAQPERTEQRLVSEAIEAVEAVDAYTRTDTYDTAEEAPEGATERTRLGIRYPELLAFVGAATEQRLANIETRIAALEAS